MKTKLLAFTLMLAAASVLGAPSVLRRSGPCQLQVAADMFDRSKVFNVELTNADLHVTASFRGGKFFDDFTVFANPTIKNKAGQNLHVAYQVAFFDKAGDLVACAGQNGEVDAGESDMQFGSAMSRLPQAEFARIASYKVVVYVDVAKARK